MCLVRDVIYDLVGVLKYIDGWKLFMIRQFAGQDYVFVCCGAHCVVNRIV